MSKKIIMSLTDIRKRYDDLEILKGISLSYYHGAKIGVIGNNGAGKSTLMRIMAGVDTEFEGTRHLDDGATVGYMFQEPTLNTEKDVWGNVQEAVQPIHDLIEDYNQTCEAMGTAETDAEMNKLQRKFERLETEIEAKDAWEVDRHLERAMEALDLPPKDADVNTLSGGERRRVALCKILLQRPDMLILDEPTNHLDAESVAWLEQHLKDYQGTVILVTHDRYFLDNVVGWMLEIEKGLGFPYEGNYTAYLQQKAARLDVGKRREASRKRVISRELEWMRQTPKARQAKSKARIKRFNELVNQEVDVQEDTVDLPIPPGPRLGHRVVSFNGVTKGYGDRVLIENLSFELPPGGIVGVIGPNGTGKTTLMRMIMGTETPDSGSIDIGKTVAPCYIDQNRATLDDKKTVFEEITDGVDQIKYGDKFISSRAYVGRFRFRGNIQQQRVGDLSGGQRNRVQLAKLLRHGANLLMLDEPTNDLDLQTLRVLEEAIQKFPGCAVVVSHDRYFLNRIATHILAFEGDGKVHFFEGDYDIYHDWKRKKDDEEGGGDDSKKGKYRKF